MTVTADAFLNVIEQIYTVPLNENGWEKALLSISQLFGATASTFSGTYSNQQIYQPSFVVHDTKNEEAMQEYIDYYFKICERARFSRLETVGSVYFDHKYFSEHQIAHSEYYDYITRHGGKYAMGATLARPNKALSVNGTQQCAVHFSSTHGHPDEHTIAQFQRLVPHMMRANQLHQKLNRNRNEMLSLTSAFDSLNEAIVGLDRDSNICFANQQAEKILKQRDGITTKGPKLRLSNAQDQKVFGKTLSDLAMGEGLLLATPMTPITINRPSGKRPYVLYVAPTGSLDVCADDVSLGVLSYLVSISEPDAPLKILAQDLSRIFDLTPRESALALALANGLSLSAYCELNGISVETARWHLGNVFSKTSSHKQSDLIRLICSLSAPKH